MIGPLTSRNRAVGRLLESNPSSRLRSTFLHHHDRIVDHDADRRGRAPKSRQVLIEKPSSSMKANVPTIDTGTATSGMIEARQVCRNTITTAPRAASPRRASGITALIDCSTKRSGRRRCRSRPGGEVLLHLLHRAPHLVRQRDRVRTSAPGRSRSPRGLLLRSERSADSPAPSSTRATSFRRSTPAVAEVRRMTVADSSSVARRPCALTAELEVGVPRRGGRAHDAGGDLLVLPRAARAPTSAAVTVRLASFCGSIHTRIA